MDTTEFVSRLELFGQGTAWVTQVFVVVFIALLLDLIHRGVSRRFLARAEKTTTPWDEAIIKAVRRPVSLLIWITGIAFAANIAAVHTEAEIFNAVGPIRDVGIIFCVAWFLTQAVTNLQEGFVATRKAQGKTVDKTTADAIGKLFRASIIITATLVALQTLGFSISGVLAFGGIGGIAVGFAAKDLLANFFGGLTIYLDRPFSVGDWIRSPDRDIEGTVEHIGWRLTRIRTFDKRPLYVPNATFSSIAVENPSRMLNRRIYETIGIRYDDVAVMAQVVADVKAMLQNHPEIDPDQTLIVNFDSFAPSSLDFFVYTFTRTTDWVHFHEVKQDVLLKITDIIASHGAEIAFPTSTVHVPEGLALSGDAAIIAPSQ